MNTNGFVPCLNHHLRDILVVGPDYAPLPGQKCSPGDLCRVIKKAGAAIVLERPDGTRTGFIPNPLQLNALRKATSEDFEKGKADDAEGIPTEIVKVIPAAARSIFSSWGMNQEFRRRFMDGAEEPAATPVEVALMPFEERPPGSSRQAMPISVCAGLAALGYSFICCVASEHMQLTLVCYQQGSTKVAGAYLPGELSKPHDGYMFAWIPS